MKQSLQQALDTVEMTYAELVDIANDMVNPLVEPITKLIEDALSNIEKLSNDNIRDLMLKLSLNSYRFSDIKEKSALKSACAEALRKEKYARSFNASEGSVAAKDNVAILESSGEVVIESVYDLVSNLFKIKLDELHRIVDTLKTVLNTRVQELRSSQTFTIGEPGEKTYLAE